MVSIKSKVWALHVQWTRRLVTCPASWVHFLYFYFWDCLSASPLDVLSRPSDFTLGSLPPFYRSFLSAWRAVDGGFLLVMVLLRLVALPVCLYLLFPLFPRSRSTPFCCLRISLLLIVLSSLPLFLVLYIGHVPGVSCFCLMLIVLSLILPGKLHMEFFTLLIVLLPLVTLFGCLVFVILRLNLSIIFSSNALLLNLFFLGFNLLCFVGLCLLLL